MRIEGSGFRFEVLDLQGLWLRIEGSGLRVEVLKVPGSRELRVPSTVGRSVCLCWALSKPKGPNGRENAPLRAVLLSRHKWPGELVDTRPSQLSLHRVSKRLVHARLKRPKIASIAAVVTRNWKTWSLKHPSDREIGNLLPNSQRRHRTLHVQKDVLPYRGTSPIRKRPPPKEPPRTLGIGLRRGSRGVRSVVGEVPPYAFCKVFEAVRAATSMNYLSS